MRRFEGVHYLSKKLLGHEHLLFPACRVDSSANLKEGMGYQAAVTPIKILMEHMASSLNNALKYNVFACFKSTSSNRTLRGLVTGSSRIWGPTSHKFGLS